MVAVAIPPLFSDNAKERTLKKIDSADVYLIPGGREPMPGRDPRQYWS